MIYTQIFQHCKGYTHPDSLESHPEPQILPNTFTEELLFLFVPGW